MNSILDYRAAIQAKDTFNKPDKRRAFEDLKDHPYLLRILTQMQRAQSGDSLLVSRKDAEAEGMAVADANRVAVEVD